MIIQNQLIYSKNLNCKISEMESFGINSIPNEPNVLDGYFKGTSQNAHNYKYLSRIMLVYVLLMKKFHC